MAQALGTAPGRLDAILAGAGRATPLEQRLISAYLKVPARELFTDLAPA
jgi:hypothetical protein